MADHRSFIHHEDRTLLVILSSLKLNAAGVGVLYLLVNLPVDGIRFPTGMVGDYLGRPTGGSEQHHPVMKFSQRLSQSLDHAGLAGASVAFEQEGRHLSVR